MKKYKRKIHMFPLRKLTLAALSAALVTAIIDVLFETDTLWSICAGALTVELFMFILLDIMGAAGKYRFSDKCIQVFYLILYKKLDYSWFQSVVISNAAYNNGYGYLFMDDCSNPMQYRVKGNGINRKVTFPFITLHTSRYPIDKIKKGMSSHDLFFLYSERVYCLGICWMDAFRELLDHTDCAVYLLEDVYLRYRGLFDDAIRLHKDNLDRFYIITDHSIAYREYLESRYGYAP